LRVNSRTLGEEMAEDPLYGVDLSDAAIAVLEFTSDPPQGAGHPRRLSYLTSKDAYLWAGLATATARFISGPNLLMIERPLTNSRILEAIHSTVAQHLDVIVHAYNRLPTVGSSERLYVARFTQIPTRGERTDPTYNELKDIIIYAVLHDLIASFWGPTANLPAIIGQINEAIHKGYEELLNKELISDPILETGLGLAILSMLPFSVTLRTRRGQREYLRLRAALWRYERQNVRGVIKSDWRFEAARVARVIKTGVIAAFHEATKTEGEEPGTGRDHPD